ncbi:hypothetical protein EJ02DRAFT_439779 [Clathrospora elynae]|uniref:Uncharacterized protein n=1 Tax=Clathrospora elynae TaxID=706981 RepID=A0A6A5S5A3_9PLEO|nr:hypothetical protein EJ02DRAFT_439779 [Clathrospora elynae]
MFDQTPEQVTTVLQPPFAPRPIPPTSSTPTSILTASQTSHHNGSAIGVQSIIGTAAIPLSPAANLPLTPLDSLPTITGSKHIVLVNDSIPEFLHADLNLERLNRIHGYLWMAGRPMRARALHRYRMMGFNMLHTQQMDLHLLKFSDRLLLKPLPEWILCSEFWNEYICKDAGLHASACGFLLSYVWLVVSPLDMKIAHELDLLPDWMTWIDWKERVKEFYGLINVNTLHQVNQRYQFGELRLGRINSIYRTRFFTSHFVRGYLYGYNRYVIFFQRNFSWILIVFVFFSLVLSAMQVGQGLEELKDNRTFLKSCYGFVVASMVSVAAVLGVVAVLFLGIFLFNMGAAVKTSKRVQRERMAIANQKEEAGKEA